MTRIERYQAKLDSLRARQRQLALSGKICTAQTFEAKIRDLEKAIEDMRPKPLREFIDKATLNRLGLLHKIIALHLAADFLNDCCFDYTDTLGKLGLVDTTLTPEVTEIKRLSGHLASRLCELGIPSLTDFMTENDKYISGVSGFTTAYINDKIQMK